MVHGRCNYALLFLFLTLNLGFAASAVQSTKEPEKPEEVNWNGDFTQGWQQYDQLIDEQKYQTASSLVEKMLVDARAKNNNYEWTRCLIRYAQHDLENYLKPLASVPWWAKGMAQLAEFIQSEDEPDSLICARQIAIVGAAVYPESIGGKKCRVIQKDIEMPDYSLSGMQNDNPRKKSLLVTHKNLEKIFFRAYSIDLPHEIEAFEDFRLPEGRDLENLIAQNSPSRQWEVTLPDTLDYRVHRTFVIPPMTRPGAYIIVASARPEFPYSDNELHGLYMTVGNLALVSREEAGGLVVTVLSGSNGRPVAGADSLQVLS
jgi:alpha-2-macroglobulin